MIKFAGERSLKAMAQALMLRRVAVLVVAASLCSAGGACSSGREILAKEGPPVFGSETEEAGADVSPDLLAELCPSTECPPGRVACPNKPFPCAVDLSSDDENCGACGVRCRQDEAFLETFHAIMTCSNAACQLVCSPGYADCNGNVEDGCEVETLENPKNCGACGTVCDVCYAGRCGCKGSDTYCPGAGCVSLYSSDDNCGACGNACPESPESNKPPLPPEQHAYYGCAFGICEQPKCDPPHADCNHDLGDPNGDGCEVADITSDPKNCGTCGNECGPGESCSDGKCICPCGAPCFNLNSDPDNCGLCGFYCPGDNRSRLLQATSLGVADPAHGRPICDQGVCGYRCSSHWGDCDADISNGCETSLLVDPLNCGACGVRCDGIEGQACVNGQCLMKECPEKGGTR
ncbi:Tryptophan synthase alpha chain [Labilithrix luteola]|uniref:Tryptophan synthase alpha chain n=1 Tax=Labilithrix luteola TaxID=1391654 RepID=A0A0K1PY62_9BACT|nr:hypothetical protein [Labilithrix luteola]AKU98468.1 Tryptophan synthase alpha chain [Labilithrix luteola]